MKKAVFFDRDGVINIDYGYVYKQEDFEFCHGIFEVLRFCKERGFLLLVVTNQSGIGRGYYTLEDFHEITTYMQHELKNKLGFCFDSVYFCPHTQEDACICRKPKSGMIMQAKKDYDLRLGECFIIGDKMSDMLAGQISGIRHKILIAPIPNEQHQGIRHLHIIPHVASIREIMQHILTPLKE